MKIAGLGNALVDVLIQLSDESVIQELKLPKGSMQLIDNKFIPKINDQIKGLKTILLSGGSAANTIHGLAKLGERCSFIGKVGNDDYGDFYNNDLIRAGVNSNLYKTDTETGRAFTFITPDSERTFATYLGAAIELSPDDINKNLLKGIDILHVEGYLVQNTKLVEAALKIAKECGIKCSLDLASYNVVESNKKFLSEIIPQFIDIVFANEEEAKAYTGMTPTDALDLIGSQCEIAVVKIGKDGALIKQDNLSVKVDAIPTKVVDTTGAGDQFAAGFLHGYSEHQEIAECGKIGALLAGNVIANYGARIPDELWPDIDAKIQKMID